MRNKGFIPLLLLFFYKDGFGIKLSTKVDIPLNKETKPKLNLSISLFTCQLFIILYIYLSIYLSIYLDR